MIVKTIEARGAMTVDEIDDLIVCGGMCAGAGSWEVVVTKRLPFSCD